MVDFLASRIWEAISGLAAFLNICFFGYHVFDSYFKKLRFELYVDNWVSVKHRCCDETCENPHLDFKCTLVAIGPKNKVIALTIGKTELLLPSGNKVEASPNNHEAEGVFWGSHTPIIVTGGEKKSFTVSYKPEIETFKSGMYSIDIRLKSKQGLIVKSVTEKFEVKIDKLAKLTALQRNSFLNIGLEDHS